MKQRKPLKKRVKAGTGKTSAAARKALFVEAYLSNGENATQAAIASGYSAKSARWTGARLSTDAYICAEIEKRRAEVIEKAKKKTQLTADEVMASLARDLRFDPVKAFKGRQLIAFEDMDADTRRALRGLSFDAHGLPNIKFPEQTSAREQGMKHFGLYKEDNKQRGESLALSVVFGK